MKKLILVITIFLSFISFNNICLADDEYKSDIENLVINLNFNEDDTYFFIDYQFKLLDAPDDNILIINKYGTELMDSNATYTEDSTSYVFTVEDNKEYSMSFRVKFSHSSAILLSELFTSEGYSLRYEDYKINMLDSRGKVNYNSSSHDYRKEKDFNGKEEGLSSHKIYLVVNPIIYEEDDDGINSFMDIFTNIKYQISITIYAVILMGIHTMFRTICENNSFDKFNFYFVIMLVTTISVPILIMPFSAIILGIFYIPFFILAFFSANDKSIVFVKMFVAFHSLMLSGCVVNPVAYLLAIFLINSLGNFYKKYKGIK